MISRDETKILAPICKFYSLGHFNESWPMTRRRQWHPTPVLLPGKSHGQRSLVGCSPWGRWVGHDWVTSLSIFTFHFHALEKEMATHSSVLAWRIPGTGEPGGLQSLGLHRVGHDWGDLAAAAYPVLHIKQITNKDLLYSALRNGVYGKGI